MTQSQFFTGNQNKNGKKFMFIQMKNLKNGLYFNYKLPFYPNIDDI